MKYLLAFTLLLSACATSAPKEPYGPAKPADESAATGKKKSWMCHAISAQNEVRAHGEGHSASCEGVTDDCARKKALESCSHYHKDCEIVFCTD